MYVCGCRAVTDRTITMEIATGARSLEEIAIRCGAGGRCGGCWPEIERLISDQYERNRESDSRIAV